MQRYVNSTIDVIVDRTADELIGGILVALLLALATAGGFALLRRKISDVTTLLTCLGLAANIAGMTLAAGFVRYAGRQGMRAGQSFRASFPPPPQLAGDRGMALARGIFDAADADRNGVLTVDEAADAAAKFVREAEAIEGGAVNESLLRSALRRHLGSPAELFRPVPSPFVGPPMRAEPPAAVSASPATVPGPAPEQPGR